MGTQGQDGKGDGSLWWLSPPTSAKTYPLPRTDRMPVLLALPMKFSAKQVYFPSSDRLMFLMIKVPSGVTVTLQQGQANPGTHCSPGRGGAGEGVLTSEENEKRQELPGEGRKLYLLPLTKISVPLLQSTTAFGADRG